MSDMQHDLPTVLQPENDTLNSSEQIVMESILLETMSRESTNNEEMITQSDNNDEFQLKKINEIAAISIDSPITATPRSKTDDNDEKTDGLNEDISVEPQRSAPKHTKHTNNITWEIQSATTIVRKTSRVFHIFLIFSILFVPTAWVSVYLYVTYLSGKSITTHSISSGIRYRSTYNLVLITTIIVAFLSAFITICRVIQIRIMFEKYHKYTGRWKCFNRITAAINITGHISLILMAAFDSGRYPTPHLMFAIVGVSFLIIFGVFTSFISCKERYMIYHETNKLFVWDALLQGLIAFIAGLSILAYIIDFGVSCAASADIDCQVTAVGNIGEWFCFILLNVVLTTFLITFRRDRLFYELREWWRICEKTQKENEVIIKEAVKNIAI